MDRGQYAGVGEKSWSWRAVGEIFVMSQSGGVRS